MRCSKCEKQKPISCFGVDKAQARGRKYSCKDCLNGARRGRYQKENRKYHLMSKYGITPREFDKLQKDQSYSCAICKEQPQGRSGGKRALISYPLFVDHCHHTGRVRGLLCHTCNVALGLFKEMPGRLSAAIQYLNGGEK